jgi:hypothetical protein
LHILIIIGGPEAFNKDLFLLPREGIIGVYKNGPPPEKR